MTLHVRWKVDYHAFGASAEFERVLFRERVKRNQLLPVRFADLAEDDLTSKSKWQSETDERLRNNQAHCREISAGEDCDGDQSRQKRFAAGGAGSWRERVRDERRSAGDASVFERTGVLNLNDWKPETRAGD